MTTFEWLPIDDKLHDGYTHVLHEVLEELGVPREKCRYSCHYRVGPNGLEDYFLVTIQIFACKEVSELQPFTNCEAESTITSAVLYASRSALRFVMRHAYECLKSGPYHLLPRALNTLENAKGQWEEAEGAVISKEDTYSTRTGTLWSWSTKITT